MKKFVVKNYKGNLLESIEKFSNSYKNLKIIEAVEDKKVLKIKAKEINEDKEEDFYNFNNTLYWKRFESVKIGDIAKVTYIGDEICVVIKKTDVKGIGGKDKLRDLDPDEIVHDDDPVIVCQHFEDGKIYNYIYNLGVSVPNSTANIKNITAI